MIEPLSTEEIEETRLWLDDIPKRMERYAMTPIFYSPLKSVCYVDVMDVDPAAKTDVTGSATAAITKRRSLPEFTQIALPKIRRVFQTTISQLWNDDSWIPNSLRRNIEDYAAIDGESLDAETEALAKDRDDHFWPHKKGCPVCGSDAYVGFASVECSNGGCSNFVRRAGM